MDHTGVGRDLPIGDWPRELRNPRRALPDATAYRPGRVCCSASKVSEDVVDARQLAFAFGLQPSQDAGVETNANSQLGWAGSE